MSLFSLFLNLLTVPAFSMGFSYFFPASASAFAAAFAALEAAKSLAS
jgi:hypothetical protein